MSNRAVKKLKQRMQKKEEDDDTPVIATHESASDFTAPSLSKQSLFSMLNDDEESSANNNDNDDAADDKPVFIASASKNKKQQKKDAKKKKAQKEKEDLEFLEQEFQKAVGVSAETSNASPSTPVSASSASLNNKFALFEIKDKNALNPDFEFKKIFGMQKKSSLGGSSNASANMASPMSASGSALKKTLLVSQKGNWPPYYNPGLQMNLVGTAQDAAEIYQFEMSNNYANLQRQFNVALETHDPNNLVQLVHYNPFHVATLMQLAEVYSMQGDRDVAQDFVERALYVMESCASTSFSKAMLLGKARLPYYANLKEVTTEQEWNKVLANQQMYHTLLKRTHTLIATGCVATALEYCKLALQFSLPNDHAHVLTFIDYVALRARQFQYLLDLLQQLPNLTQIPSIVYLPNLMLSKAFAYFYLEQRDLSDKYLQEALRLWPMMLPSLVNQLSAQNSLQLAQWEPMIRNTLFTDSICNNRVCSTLIVAAVDRLSEMWKLIPQQTPQLVDWLKKNVQAILLKPNQQQEQYNKQRSSVFADMKFINMYSDFAAAEATGKLLPPTGFPNNTGVNNANNSSAGGSGASGENPFTLFLSSLLPWNRTGATVARPAPAENGDDEEEEIVVDD